MTDDGPARMSRLPAMPPTDSERTAGLIGLMQRALAALPRMEDCRLYINRKTGRITQRQVRAMGELQNPCDANGSEPA